MPPSSSRDRICEGGRTRDVIATTCATATKSGVGSAVTWSVNMPSRR